MVVAGPCYNPLQAPQVVTHLHMEGGTDRQ